MSRKSHEDKSAWNLPSFHVFVGEYGPFKTKGLEAIEDTLIWICHSSDDESMMRYQPETKTTDIDDGATVEKEHIDYDRRHPMISLSGAAQECLLKRSHHDNKNSTSRFRSILVVDIQDMFECDEDYQEALQNEMEQKEVTKVFGKKLVRIFQRLLLQNATVAVQGSSLGSIALKLYQALYQVDPDMISEIWLIHSELSNKFINTHLAGFNSKIYPAKLVVVSQPGSEFKKDPQSKGKPTESKKHPKSKGKKKKGKKTAAGVCMSSGHTGSRMSILQHYFPESRELEFRVKMENMNWFSIVDEDHDLPSTAATMAIYDSEYNNTMGKMLFMSSLKVEMNRFSKQYERLCTDVTRDLLMVLSPEEDDQVNDLAIVDWSKCERHVGALVLRGHKCILVRSVEQEWQGMRFPSVVPFPGESASKAAIRAVEEMAEVDASEVTSMPFMMPVAVYGPNGRRLIVELHPLYATGPPPNLDTNRNVRPAEDCEEEDDEDPYDWYSFPRAVIRLEDSSSVAALQTMVANLQQGVKAGLVPNKWGGIFGQENCK